MSVDDGASRDQESIAIEVEEDPAGFGSVPSEPTCIHRSLDREDAPDNVSVVKGCCCEAINGNGVGCDRDAGIVPFLDEDDEACFPALVESVLATLSP